MSYEINKRWRLRHPQKRNEGKKRNYATTSFGNANHRHHYTDHEDDLVLDPPGTDRELHKLIGRSVQSIQVRRSKLKKDWRDVGVEWKTVRG